MVRPPYRDRLPAVGRNDCRHSNRDTSSPLMLYDSFVNRYQLENSCEMTQKLRN